MLDTFLKGDHPRTIPPNLLQIGPVVLEELIKMQKESLKDFLL
jgi:hypothetical protein